MVIIPIPAIAIQPAPVKAIAQTAARFTILNLRAAYHLLTGVAESNRLIEVGISISLTGIR